MEKITGMISRGIYFEIFLEIFVEKLRKLEILLNYLIFFRNLFLILLNYLIFFRIFLRDVKYWVILNKNYMEHVEVRSGFKNFFWIFSKCGLNCGRNLRGGFEEDFWNYLWLIWCMDFRSCFDIELIGEYYVSMAGIYFLFFYFFGSLYRWFDDGVNQCNMSGGDRVITFTLKRGGFNVSSSN